ncbi:MAG: lysophospholipid acyltransferase family protein [Lachnospiraceae bacterium]
MNKLFLYFTKLTGFLPAQLILRWKIHYENKAAQSTYLPKGTILMSNHKSLWDFPLYLVMFFRAPVHFLIAEVIYEKGAFMSWLLKSLGCIRVNRTTYDFSFIDECVDLLKKGERIGIFPEGQLPRNGKMSKFAPSCVMIALAADAEIVPVFTEGNYGFFNKNNVMIGERIYLRDICKSEHPSREEIQACNDYLLARILELEKKLKEQTGTDE